MLESYPLTKEKFNLLVEVYSDYKLIPLELVDCAFENKIKSHVKLRKSLYEKLKRLKRKHSKLPITLLARMQ